MLGSKFTSAFLSASLCLSFVPASAFVDVIGDYTQGQILEDAPQAQQALDESGTSENPYTAENPYLVDTVEDLNKLQDILDDHRDAHVKMTADISVGDWEPIRLSGYATEAFCGVFDGNGHSITDMRINSSVANTGFFGNVYGGTIKNLHVSGTVSSTKSKTGGIVGYLQTGSLENCSFTGEVTSTATGSTAYTGGLVGCAGNSASQTAGISGCYNSSSVIGAVCGGIVGYGKYTTIDSSYNTGDVNGNKRAGGICGQAQNDCTISHCYNAGEITGSAAAADIVDFLYSSSTISSCGYPNKPFGAGTGKIDEDSCIKSDSPADYITILGDAFNQGPDGPVLKWQGGTTPDPVDPGKDPDPKPDPNPDPDDPKPDVPSETEKSLDEIIESLSVLYPEYGTDSNIVDMIKAKYPNVDVTLKAVTNTNGTDNCSDITETGDIRYFYTDDLDAFRGSWFGSYKIEVELKLDDVTKTATPSVIVYWDRQKVNDLINKEIIGNINLGDISNVSSDLTLPIRMDGKPWASIEWSASDASVIEIGPKSPSIEDQIYGPYVGKVKCGDEPRDVTLTATVTFNKTNDVIGSKKPISVKKEYSIHVVSLDEAKAQEIRKDLMAKIDAGFESAGIRDYVTGKKLAFDGNAYVTENDIQLPTTRDFGVDGKYYPVTLATSNPDVLTVPEGHNNARAYVLRPVGTDGFAALSVSISDKDTGISATKKIPIRVKKIDTIALRSEYTLMDQAKEHYFDGLNNGANPSANEIYSDLTPFFEVYVNGDELVWVRDNADRKNTGIVPVAQEGWEELELWRLFKSSNAKVVSHENLKVTRQAEPKAVTIKSVLSHEVYGKYGELYAKDPIKYKEYAIFAPLYNQEVSAELLVRGTDNPKLMMARSAPVKANFAVTDGSNVLYSGIYQELPEGTTAWDVFKQMVPAGCYTHKGSYVSSITGPDGSALAEKGRGPNSGWLYSVNGVLPSVALGNYVLEDGDRLVLFYTDDGSAYGHWEWPTNASGGGDSQGAGSGSSSQDADPDSTGDSDNTQESTATENADATKPDDNPQSPDSTEIPVYSGWTKIPKLEEGQKVNVVSPDGTTREVQPLTVDEDTYVPLADDETYEVVDPPDSPEEVQPDNETTSETAFDSLTNYWWLPLAGMGVGAVVVVVVLAIIGVI